MEILNNPQITIFTPTYNRVNTLKKLGYSLFEQTNKRFIWLIVDDGSNDETERWVKKFKKKVDFDIRYLKQNNSGKHVAFNKAIENCFTDYLVNVDSDDIVSKEAINDIYNITKNLDEKSIGVICGKKIGNNYDNNKWSKIEGLNINIMDAKEIYGIIETTIIFKTKYLKKYRFPVFFDDNNCQEKFAPEGLLYNQLINDGTFKVVNKCFYFAEYQEDGLTKKLFKKTWVNNFYGVVASLSNKYALCNYPGLNKLKTRTKCIFNINALCLKKNKNCLKFTPSKIMSIVLFVPSVVYYWLRFK